MIAIILMQFLDLLLYNLYVCTYLNRCQLSKCFISPKMCIANVASCFSYFLLCDFDIFKITSDTVNFSIMIVTFNWAYFWIFIVLTSGYFHQFQQMLFNSVCCNFCNYLLAWSMNHSDSDADSKRLRHNRCQGKTV